MPNAYIPADIPQDAKSEYAKYTAAVERDISRENRRNRAVWVMVVFVGIGFVIDVAEFGLGIRNDLELVKVAMHQPVRYIERGPDGMDRLIAVRNTVSNDKGREMETVNWFVSWSRWISPDKAVTSMHRSAARAKLAGPDAVNRWDAIIANDPDSKDGYARDVLGVVVAEQEIVGLEPGKRNYQVSWQEKTLRNGKVVSDKTMTQNITVIQGPPRDGAWDGVNVVLLTEPTAHIKQRVASN